MPEGAAAAGDRSPARDPAPPSRAVPQFATVIATAGANLFADRDESFYFGLREGRGVAIRKLTNGEHVTQAPGPSIPVGSPVTWTYVITNASPFTFTSLSVTDDQGVTVACPRELPPPGASITCTGSGTAVVGQYHNVGTVTATAAGNEFTDQDDSFYLGVPMGGSVRIRKFTNGEHVNQAPGPLDSRRQPCDVDVRDHQRQHVYAH